MRVGSILSLLPLALSLGSLANAHSVGDHMLESREFVDELSVREPEFTGLDAREILSDISTRELIDELSDRLERRALKYHCKTCGKDFNERPSGMAAVCQKVNVPHILGNNRGKYTCGVCHKSWNNRPTGMEAVCFKQNVDHKF